MKPKSLQKRKRGQHGPLRSRDVLARTPRTSSGRLSRAKPADQHQKRGRKPGNAYRSKGQKIPVTKPGPLTPNGTTAAIAHKDAVAEASRVVRRKQAITLFIDSGLTMAAIAKELNVSNKTVCTDIWKAVEEYRQSYLPNVKRWVPIHHARLERLILAHSASRNKPASAKVILDALKREAELLGLDKEKPGRGAVPELPTTPSGDQVHYHFYLPENGRELRPSGNGPGGTLEVSPIALPANGTETDSDA